MRLLVIDNYDSFTWNLVHYLIELGAGVDVLRNDDARARDAAFEAEVVVISPGPGDPDGAGATLDIVTMCAARRVPLLGVCLGHQAIARSFGGRVGRAQFVMHGKTSAATHDGTDLFAGLPSPFDVARYHSLVVADLPDVLLATAWTPDRTIMGLAHRTLPIYGVQFHPESVATQHGHALLANFLRLAAERMSA